MNFDDLPIGANFCFPGTREQYVKTHDDGYRPLFYPSFLKSKDPILVPSEIVVLGGPDKGKRASCFDNVLQLN